MTNNSQIYVPKLPALHESQQKVADSNARWKILCAGRRFGKTRLGVQLCMQVALNGGRAWWVAPTFAIARVGWRDIQASATSFPKEIEPSISIANMEFKLANGGEIAVRSADNPQRLRGEGLDFIVIDEAAFVKPEVWSEVLRPTLTERKGGALFISTPMGMNNWFFDLWETAEHADNWERFRFSTYDNPRIDSEEVDQAKNEVGSIVFAQEYLAEFVDAGQGMIKPDWMQYFTQDSESGNYLVDGETIFKKECTYFIATDIATSVSEDADYTAIIVFAMTPDNRLLVVDCRRDRFEGPDIVGAIQKMVDKHKAGWVTMERQGFQLSLIQMAQRQGLRGKEVKPDKDKVARALTLSARMEAGDVYFKGDAPWLTDMERELFTFPVGAHDDMVDALGYGVLNLNERRQWTAY